MPLTTETRSKISHLQRASVQHQNPIVTATGEAFSPAMNESLHAAKGNTLFNNSA